MKRLMLIVVQAVMLGAIMGAAAWSTLTGARDAERLRGLHVELTHLQDIDSAIADYALEVAHYMVRGRAEQDDLQASRLTIERTFLGLGRALRDRVAFDSADGKPDGALTDFENARRMLELYHAIDRAASRAIVRQRDGQGTEAADIYARDVDYRITTEFAALINAARAGSEDRISAAEARSAEHGRTIIVVWGAIAGVGLLILAGSAWLLWRRPLHLPDNLARDYEKRVEELRLSNQRLRELDTRRGQFLADVSHELRTPLTILRGEADVALLPRAKSEDQRKSLESIRDQAAELGQLLDDLLAFARSEGEAQAADAPPVLLNELVANAADDGETLAEPREVVLRTQLPEAGIWALAEARRLKQALIIGLDNAVNHSPPGTTITVALTQRDGWAEITIADEGSGIAPADEAHVFDRFYRGDGHATESGLGIGLAIAKTIVDQHGGTIALDNRAEGGAVMTICLPVHEGGRA